MAWHEGFPEQSGSLKSASVRDNFEFLNDTLTIHASSSANPHATSLQQVTDVGASTTDPITVTASGSILKALRVQNNLLVGDNLEVKKNGTVDGNLEIKGTETIDGASLTLGNNAIIYIPGFQMGSTDWRVWSSGHTFNIGVGTTPYFYFDLSSFQIRFTELWIGDGTSDSDKMIYANNGDANKPAIKYNETTNVWQYSNNGVIWHDMISSIISAPSVPFDVEKAALGDGSSGSYAPSLSLITTTDADIPKLRIYGLKFDDTIKQNCFFQQRLPANYSSGGRLKVQFYMDSDQVDNTKAVRFEAALIALTPGVDTDIMTALDISNDGGGWAHTVYTLNYANPALKARLCEATITLNLDSMSAGDFIAMGFRRNANHSNDTAVGNGVVIAIDLEFNY